MEAKNGFKGEEYGWIMEQIQGNNQDIFIWNHVLKAYLIKKTKNSKVKNVPLGLWEFLHILGQDSTFFPEIPRKKVES